jgi:uncharacterized membrane protein YtjA (UPF0391 family)
MLYYALMLLLVGLVAGALRLFGVAAVAGQIAWLLFPVGVVIPIVQIATGRGYPSLVRQSGYRHTRDRAVLQAALVGEPNMALSRLAGAPKV